MSGPPVVITTSLGRPVTNVASLNGAVPMVVVDALGEPVTLVDAGGEPVTLLNADGTLWSGSVSALAQILALEPTALWWPTEATMTVARDGTGAAPVAGQPVGRMLDLTPNAVNAIAPTDAARPLLGRVPVTGRRNLLTYTEQFDNAAWGKSNATVTANAAVSPDGTMTADTVTALASGAAIRQDYSPMQAADYTFSFWAKTPSGSLSFPMYIIGPTTLSQTTVNVTTTWQRFTFTATVTAGTGGRVQIGGGGLPTSGAEYYIWGAQLELGSTATAYQRVVTALDVTEAGVAEREYLDFDVVDDQLAGTLADGTYYLATVATNGDVSYSSTVLSGGTGLVINTDLSALIVRGTDYSAGEKATIEGVFA